MARPSTCHCAVISVDYPAPLREVPKLADMPKPCNLVGPSKEQPVEQMKKLLLTNIFVHDDAVPALADQRGAAAVRDYLASRDLPWELLFLGADKSGPVDAKWTPRTELNLAMR